jgi:hypothetical protein
MNWNGCGRKRSWRNLKYQPETCQKKMRKIKKRDLRSFGITPDNWSYNVLILIRCEMCAGCGSMLHWWTYSALYKNREFLDRGRNYKLFHDDSANVTSRPPYTTLPSHSIVQRLPYEYRLWSYAPRNILFISHVIFTKYVIQQFTLRRLLQFSPPLRFTTPHHNCLCYSQHYISTARETHIYEVRTTAAWNQHW